VTSPEGRKGTRTKDSVAINETPKAPTDEIRAYKKASQKQKELSPSKASKGREKSKKNVRGQGQ